jgi:hypothetical protein
VIASAARESTAADTSDELRILDREPRKFAFAQWRNITLLAWAAQADAAEIERLKRALPTVVGHYPGGRSTVSVIAEGLPPPTQAAREKIVEILNANASDLACVAVVVAGSGFSSSALRSVHTGLRFVTPRSYEMMVLGSVDEVGPRLAPSHAKKTGVVIEPAKLVEVVRQLQAIAASADPVVQ